MDEDESRGSNSESSASLDISKIKEMRPVPSNLSYTEKRICFDEIGSLIPSLNKTT